MANVFLHFYTQCYAGFLLLGSRTLLNTPVNVCECEWTDKGAILQQRTAPWLRVIIQMVR